MIDKGDKPDRKDNKLLGQLEWWFGNAFALVFFWQCLASFGSNVDRVFQSSDTAWLIKTGQYIMLHGLPATDPFSYTCTGKSIVVYQWVFALAAGALFSAGGLWLVGLAAAVIVALIIFCLMPGMMLRQGVKPVYMLGLLSLTNCPPWFWARPQLVSFFLIPVFSMLLESYRKDGLQKKHWLLPLLMVLWVNAHSFWFIGLAMVAFYLLKGLIGADSPLRMRLILLLCGCLLAPFASPYGPHLIAYNLTFLSQPDFGNIRELQPDLLRYADRHRGILTYLTIAVLALFVGRRKVPLPGLVLSAASICAALMFYRFVPVAVLLTWPYLGLALGQCHFAAVDRLDQANRDANRAGGFFTSLAIAALTISFAAAAYIVRFPIRQPIWFTYLNSNHDAVMFIKQHPQLKERMFCDAAVGCSEIFEELGPVFIDTRFDFYGRKFCQQYYDCINATGDWQAYFKSWHIAAACITNDWPLYKELKKSWLPIFDDGSCSIWQPDTERNRQLMEAGLSDRAGNNLYRRFKYKVKSRPITNNPEPGSQAPQSGSSL